jgi:hypothetical protein
MTLDEIPRSVDVPIRSLIDLAIECWRLNRWLAHSEGDSSFLAIRHVARRLGEFLKGNEIETMDLTGHPYEAGLAVEVVDSVKDESAAEGYAVIDETISPIVVWHGTVVKLGQVVMRGPK